MNSKASDVSERPDCDICGQPYHRHMEICGAGMMCPVSAVSYRPKRAATLSPPLPSLEVERLREALKQWICPSCGGARVYTHRWRDVTATLQTSAVPCKVCEGSGVHPIALAALSALPLDGGLSPKCANPCCASPAAGFPVIYFGPAQEPRRYRLEVPKGMCGECQSLFQADTFFTDASRVEMSRMIDAQGLALPDYDRLAVEWIGIEDPTFAELAALREARLWFG